MAFGDKLQTIRHAAGLTQEQMAEELQVSRQAVSRWESNRSFPEVEKILYIANRYGVSMAELFEEEVPTEQPRPEEVVKNHPLEAYKNMNELSRYFFRHAYLKQQKSKSKANQGV